MSSPPAPKLVDTQGNPLREVRLASIGDVIENLPTDDTVILLFSGNQNSWYIYQYGKATLYTETMLIPKGILPADLFSGGGGGGGGGAVVPVPVAASSASVPASTSSLSFASHVPHGFKMRRNRHAAPTSSVTTPTSSASVSMGGASSTPTSAPVSMGGASSTPTSASAPTSSLLAPMSSESASVTVIADDSGSMSPNKYTTVNAVCAFVSRQNPNVAITIAGFESLIIRGSSATVSDEFRRSYSPSIDHTPLYRRLIETIRSFPEDEHHILVAFTDGADNASHPLTPQSVRNALAKRPNVVFWFMASTRDAEAIGTAMGAHSVLPYSDAHIEAALEAVNESQTVYRQTGTAGGYSQRQKKAARGER